MQLSYIDYPPHIKDCHMAHGFMCTLRILDLIRDGDPIWDSVKIEDIVKVIRRKWYAR